MQFSKFASLSVLFFVAIFGVVVANPVERAASTDAQVVAALKSLQSNIQSPIASIKKVSNSTHPNFASAAPYVSEITIELTAASGKIHAIKPTKSSKRQSTDAADLTASIVSEIASTTALLGGTKADSIVSSLLPGLDTALDTVLTDLETLLAGVLTLVATLLVDVAGILENLALGLTLGSLGL